MIKNRFWIFLGLLAIPISGMVLWLALHHRYIYSEECKGLKTFDLQPFGKISSSLIDESSGLFPAGNDEFYTHNDDTDSSLYRISAKGKLVHRYRIPLTNRDWEEVTGDGKGRIFIGDFGNNLNLDKPLKILIVRPDENRIEGEIRFRYQEHNQFPPTFPSEMNFDCEAMVYSNDSIYLFTKNKTERSTCFYVLPARPGKYVVKKRQRLPLLGLVTGAALRPDGKELALLTYGKVYFYTLSNGLSSLPEPDFCFPGWKFRQSEAISYWGNNRLLVGNEQGEIFLLNRK